MKTEIIAAETGYVGSLTPEQEKKLHQLWGLLLDAFKFDAAELEAAHPQDPAAAGSRAEDNGAAPSHHQVDVGQHSVNRVLADELRRTWLSMLKRENPDGLLLRFLRARKWDVAQASSMLINALVWRYKQARVDEDVLPKGEPWCAQKEKTGTGNERKYASEFLEQYRLGKVYLRGVDRRGRPVGYIHLAAHKPGAQSQETLEKLVVQTIETARCLFVAPPNEAFCLVFDLTGFSLSNMEWQPVRYIIQAFEANYPECLGSLLIHNAPWIFSGIWKIIRGLLDPIVASKVDFTRNLDELEKYIPRENIICRLGGGDNWHYTYHEPGVDEDVYIARVDEREIIQAERREIARRLLAATQAWIKHESVGGHKEAIAQEHLRRTEIEALRANYWTLDPYVRSRTYLDRAGVIRPGGSIEFYPDRKVDVGIRAEDEKRRTSGASEETGVAAHREIAVAGS
ncbi:phosphatidylinositol transfer protein [Nemania abortiva]|nr:phosphatidylinositol transfer protein [Nemania abortiva]